MKNEGITMLQIVITIIIMVILATVAVLYGRGVPREANIVSVYNETQEIESALKEASILRQLKLEEDELVIFGELRIAKLNPSEYDTVLKDNDEGTYDASKNYFYLDFTSSKKLTNVLEIENIKRDYILDFENMNIYLVKGIELNQENNATSTIKYNSDYIESYYQSTFSK